MLRKVLLTFLMVAFLGSMAWAVEVNPGGQGDALIMGYYNARNALTYFRLVNTSDQGIVGKVRFREGKRSEEVLDFIVCLSKKDEFSMILVDGGPTAPAVLYKGTDMISDADTTTVPGGWTMVPLRYNGTGAASTVTMDDTKEGYVEFIALSSYTGVEKLTSDQCKEMAEYGLTTLADGTKISADDAPNAVMGAVEIVKYTDNLPIFSYKATALKDTTTDVQVSNPATQTDTPLFHSVIGDIALLNDALAKTALYAMYDIRSDLGASSDLLVIFPTKKETAYQAANDFRDMYDNVTVINKKDLTQHCVVVKYEVYDDAENTITQELDFSPSEVQTNKLCYEVNYITVGEMASPILDTSLAGPAVQVGSFDFGWLKVYFDNNWKDAMPVISYELQVWVDGALSRMLETSYDIP